MPLLHQLAAIAAAAVLGLPGAPSQVPDCEQTWRAYSLAKRSDPTPETMLRVTEAALAPCRQPAARRAVLEAHRAHALETLGRTEEAREAYLAALDANPRLVSAALSLGDLAHGRGDCDESCRWYNRAFSLQDDKPDAATAQAWYSCDCHVGAKGIMLRVDAKDLLDVELLDKVQRLAPPVLRLFFDFNSDIVHEGLAELNEFAEEVATVDGLRAVEVTGHGDWIGTDEQNIEMGWRRARAVERALLTAGVPKAIIDLRSLGRSRPFASNDSEEGRALNRRAEVIVHAGGVEPGR